MVVLWLYPGCILANIYQQYILFSTGGSQSLRLKSTFLCDSQKKLKINKKKYQFNKKNSPAKNRIS